jgi:CrcB protein
MLSYLAVMGGGALGAGARLALSNLVAARFGEVFPWGTLLVNVSGCLILGIFAGLSGPDGPWFLPPWVRQFVMLGLLGGYTTYSSFSWQTILLLQDGQYLSALGNIFGTLLLCLGATWGGLLLAQNLSRLP